MPKPIIAVLTPEAKDFLKSLDKEIRQDFGVSIRRLQEGETVSNFKKLVNTDGIYEFSVNAPNHTYRLFAFWDTRGTTQTLIVCTHGLDKKTQKTPPQEIKKAEQLKRRHFDS
ncbi:type II toxin-antitoxin system RelE/ParE family toxin [Hymenobacter baengnokdamensis]|uniref:type II toxin-antitoxin system RelE/ParE family toxin n=1 Tax=Hymenobacter baengnokdamensis TaxID=2615203 RepID=UPI0012475F63|nr:type II toxin-antitoxin system RelE/ParE family toxin [Hymenobacter baengnokdamensis]